MASADLDTTPVGSARQPDQEGQPLDDNDQDLEWVGSEISAEVSEEVKNDEPRSQLQLPLAQTRGRHLGNEIENSIIELDIKEPNTDSHRFDAAEVHYDNDNRAFIVVDSHKFN